MRQPTLNAKLVGELEDYYSSCEESSDGFDEYNGGTAHYFLNMYHDPCDEAYPPPPGTPKPSDVTASTAVLIWAPSFAVCHPVKSYVVYVRPEGGVYEQVATVHGLHWAEVHLKPETEYRAKIPAVN